MGGNGSWQQPVKESEESARIDEGLNEKAQFVSGSVVEGEVCPRVAGMTGGNWPDWMIVTLQHSSQPPGSVRFELHHPSRSS